MTTSPEAVALSKDPKKRGWTFVGPALFYAFMQAMGTVNDQFRTVIRAGSCRERARFISVAQWQETVSKKPKKSPACAGLSISKCEDSLSLPARETDASKGNTQER